MAEHWEVAYFTTLAREGSFRPVQGLAIGYNTAYTRAELTTLLSDVPGLLTGFQLPGVPKWSGGLTADYSWPLNAQLSANIGAGIRYVGEKNATSVSATDPNTRDPSYTTGDARAGLSNGKWTANLFVRNVTNKRVYLTQSPQTNPFTGEVPSIDALPLESRVAGLSFDVTSWTTRGSSATRLRAWCSSMHRTRTRTADCRRRGSVS